MLYLLHGGIHTGDSWLLHTDLYEFTEFSDRPDQHAIVVMPDGGLYGGWSDWRDGSQAWESFHIRTLVPFIDRHYRTLADRRYRAVAGLSGGGLGAIPPCPLRCLRLEDPVDSQLTCCRCNGTHHAGRG